MTIRDYFSADYGEARRKFRDAATAAGAQLASYVNEHTKAPSGDAVSTDVAWIGPRTASRVLMTISATHGAEGFCGAGVQTGTFASGFVRDLPRDTALLAVHAVNPHGFAWLRRVTEDNVDLNRNFVAFDAALPANHGYVELAEAICPHDWDDTTRALADQHLADYGKRHGAAALQMAVTGGQYTHADGIFFGGASPSWSRQILLRITGDYLSQTSHIAAIDYHTGLGPYGHGERIVLHRAGTASLARAQAWFGDDITSTSLGTSSSADVVGDALTGLEHALSDKAVTGIALEYGVRPLEQSIEALRADNWLHLRGRVESPQGRAIKAAMRDTFYGDADDWKDMVFERAIETQRAALRGLAG